MSAGEPISSLTSPPNNIPRKIAAPDIAPPTGVGVRGGAPARSTTTSKILAPILLLGVGLLLLFLELG